MNPWLQVALGGALGASARYAVARAMPGFAFPVATLVVNVLGCAVMGALAGWIAARGPWGLAPLVMTGVLGGFTTFSAFALDTLALAQRAPGMAAVYVAASVGLSLLAAMAGLALAKAVLA